MYYHLHLQKQYRFVAIISLFVPILLLINLAFVIYWLIKLKKQLILSAIFLLIGWFVITPFYKLSKKNTSLNTDLKVMSYNVRTFNHWIGSDEKDIDKERCISFIRIQRPRYFNDSRKHVYSKIRTLISHINT